MKLYIVRHGETDWNTIGRLQGQSDIPLNEKGIFEAEQTSEALADIDFTKVYVSPLKRTLQTADILKRDRDIPVIVENRIIEMGFGVYEGLSTINPQYDVKDEEFAYTFKKKPSLYKAPKGGETFYEVCERTTDFLEELIREGGEEEENRLVVAHGGAICGILSSLKLNGNIDGFWDGGPMKNCGITILEIKNNKAVILKENIVLYK